MLKYVVLKSTFSCHLSGDPFTLKGWCLYMQCNMDYLAMFTLRVTSACDKFPIPLHWLYIYGITWHENNHYLINQWTELSKPGHKGECITFLVGKVMG